MTQITPSAPALQALIHFLAARLDESPRRVSGRRRDSSCELELEFPSGRVSFLSYPAGQDLPEQFVWTPSADEQRQIEDERAAQPYARQPQGMLGLSLIAAGFLGAVMLTANIDRSPRSALDDLDGAQLAQLVNWSEQQAAQWRAVWEPGQSRADWIRAADGACPLNTARLAQSTARVAQSTQVVTPVASRWLPADDMPDQGSCDGVTDVLSRAAILNESAPSRPDTFTDAQARAALDGTLKRREEQGLQRLQDPERITPLSARWTQARETLRQRGVSVPDLR